MFYKVSSVKVTLDLKCDVQVIICRQYKRFLKTRKLLPFAKFIYIQKVVGNSQKIEPEVQKRISVILIS